MPSTPASSTSRMPAWITRPRWYVVVAFLLVVTAFATYQVLWGARLSGRAVDAVVGNDWRVQFVAGYAWFVASATLLDRARARAFRRRLLARSVGGGMLFVAWTFVPLGGRSGGVAFDATGTAYAPGFGLGLYVALLTTGLVYWLVNRRRWKQEREDADAVHRALGDALRFGRHDPVTGSFVLPRDWVREGEREAYAAAVRQHHALPEGRQLSDLYPRPSLNPFRRRRRALPR